MDSIGDKGVKDRTTPVDTPERAASRHGRDRRWSLTDFAYRAGSENNQGGTRNKKKGSWGASTRSMFVDSWVRQSRRAKMSNNTRKLLLAISGQTGTTIASVIMLLASFYLFGYRSLWVLQSVVVVACIRIAYYLTRGPRPVLRAYIIRKRIGRLLVDEGKISGFFLASCFVFSWPVSHLAVGSFVAVNVIGQLALMLLARTVLAALRKRLKAAGENLFAKKIIIAGTGEKARHVADTIMDSPELETRIIGFLDFHRSGLWRYRDIPLLGRPDAFFEVVRHQQIDALFIAVEPEELSRTRPMFETAESMGVPVCLMPDVYDHTVASVRPTYINGLPALTYRATPENQLSLLAKNIVDKIAAMFGLLVAGPIMLLTALLIKLDSKGPVFYKQVRCGLNGKPFRMYKFRTMCSDAEKKKDDLLHENEMSGPVFKIKDDPRVTRIGRYLRKFSIDEVPQFINVLRGEMSLVGPRPPLPHEVAGFQPWQRRKLSVKPGVTCIWQVNGRNSIGFEEWMRLDLDYIDNWSLWLDAKIIARTIPTVIKGSGM